MSLGKNKNYLSFEILDNGNPEVLLFLDTSDYFRMPESPLLEITPPGYKNPLITNIVFGKINVLNSSTIGMSDILETKCLVELPDGVWGFKFKICPYDQSYVVGYSLRTTQLEEKLSKIYDALDFVDCDVAEDEQIKKSVIDIILSINSGKANAKRGEIRKASSLYTIASDLINRTLKKINERCSCV